MRITLIILVLMSTNAGVAQYQQVQTKTFGNNPQTDYITPVKLLANHNQLHLFALEKGEYNGMDTRDTKYLPFNSNLEYTGGLKSYPNHREPGQPFSRYFPIDILATQDQGTLLYCLADDLTDPNQNNWVARIPTLIKLDSTGKEEWLVRYRDYRENFERIEV